MHYAYQTVLFATESGENTYRPVNSRRPRREWNRVGNLYSLSSVSVALLWLWRQPHRRFRQRIDSSAALSKSICSLSPLLPPPMPGYYRLSRMCHVRWEIFVPINWFCPIDYKQQPCDPKLTAWNLVRLLLLRQACTVAASCHLHTELYPLWPKPGAYWCWPSFFANFCSSIQSGHYYPRLLINKIEI